VCTSYCRVLGLFQAFDQIIVTPPGAKCVPPIDGDLDGMGITRPDVDISIVPWRNMEANEKTRVLRLTLPTSNGVHNMSFAYIVYFVYE